MYDTDANMRRVFLYLLWAGIITALASLLVFWTEYKEDQDKKRWIKNIFKSLGYGVAVFFFPISIVLVIALGVNRKS